MGDRIAAMFGVAFTVCIAGSVAVVPAAPEYDEGAAAIRAYLTQHATALGISTVLTAVAVLALMVFFAFVQNRLPGAERDGGPVATTFLMAAAAVASSMVVAVVLEAALAQRIASVAGDSTLQAVYSTQLVVFHTASSMAMVVALLSTAIGIVRWQVFPAWLAATAILAATLTLVDNASDLATAGTSLRPLGIIAFAFVDIWIVGTSISGLRRDTASRAGVRASRRAAPRPS
jgi:hypothetical protein